MRFAVVVVAVCALCVPSGLASADPAKAPSAAAPSRFLLKAPPKFRPGDAGQRLADVLGHSRGGVWTYHEDMQPTGDSVHIGTKLLASHDVAEKNGVAHVLRFAKENGFTVETKGATPAQHQALRELLRAHGAESLKIENEPAR